MGLWADLIPDDLEPWFIPEFSMLKLLGMAFVLGNFFTATADDLDHMSSTRGFLKTWSIIVVLVLVIDCVNLLWNGYDLEKDLVPFVVKWIILLVLCVLSHMRLGVIFKLATGDVVAMASAGALLTPFLIVIFFVVLKIVDLIERPILRRFGDGEAYPFMPVVFTSYGIMLLFGLWFEGWFEGLLG